MKRANFRFLTLVGGGVLCALLAVGAMKGGAPNSSRQSAASPGTESTAQYEAEMLYPFALDGEIRLRGMKGRPDGLRLFQVRAKRAPDGAGIACYSYARKKDADDPDDALWGDVRIGSSFMDEAQGAPFYAAWGKNCSPGTGVDVTGMVQRGEQRLAVERR